ncbi:MAG TPA: ABC transporter substrate-binding protein [Chthoniobacterales bacterium]|nr:ABC transporter substrate-binding protein [Chthoniobacterales bacterium]
MRKWVEIGLLAVALLARPAPAVAESSEPEAAARGREIYENGVAADGAQIKCATGPQNTEVPAAILKCISCHNNDGRGKPEGGIYPSNIRWSELTKPYPVLMPGGRERAPYTERLLIRAMTRGLDANGNRLSSTMPRYRLSHEQASDLVAYLKELDHQHDPGVKDDSVTVGIVLPPESIHGAMSRAVRETLTAAFDEINLAGGVYGRKLLGCFVSAPLGAGAAALDEFIAREQPFALLEPYIAGDEEAAADVIQRHRIPVIQPITLSTGWFPRKARYVFHLVSGIEGQGAALVRFARTRLDATTKPSILVVNDRPNDTLIAELKKELIPAPAIGLGVADLGQIGDWNSYLREANPAAVIWLAPGAGLQEFLVSADHEKIYPLVLAPSALAGPAIYQAPKGFTARLFLSFPILPDDQSPQGHAEFIRLAERYHFTEGDAATRHLTLSAVQLLGEALRKAGREVTRENLVMRCEQLNNFGLTQMPPVSFGADRRVGTTGAHIVGVDLEKGGLAPTAQWIECDVR